EIDAPKLNEVFLYSLDPEANQYESIMMGNWLSFSERDIQHRNFATTIQLENDEVETIYMRIGTGSSVQIPLTIWDYSAYHAKSQNEYAILGIIFGLSIVMALYNLFLY